jgi:Cft2 family RNA processing exonuclease
MDKIKQIKEQFQQIIQKYNLDEEKKAKEISQFLTKSSKNKITPKEFASKFKMQEEEATIFLKFIKEGIKFKEKHIDKK